MRKKIICLGQFIFILLISLKLDAQNVDSVKCIHGAIEAVVTINQILDKLGERKLIYDIEMLGTIDSICNSKKNVNDYYDQNTILASLLSFNLGNSLNYKRHFIRDFQVAFVMYNFNALLKIKFMYPFYGKVKIDTSIINVLKSKCRLPLKFRKGKYGVDYFETEMRSEEGLELFKNKYPDINFNILPDSSSMKYSNMVKFVNDPANQLTYGFACSVGGEVPEGLVVFAYLVHYKHFEIIEKLLYSPNPVTRLYASDALEHAYRKNLYVPPLKISDKIKDIRDEMVEIEACWGCSYDKMTMKEASVKSEESKKYLYQNIFFPENEDEYNY